MKALYTALILISIVSCNSEVDYSNSGTSTYQETKMTLEEKEKQNPLDFLEASGTYRQNLIDQWVLEGNVINKASVATYKDVVLHIVYFSKTGTEIGSEDKPIYEYFKPNSSQSFKIKTTGYEGTESIGFEVTSASAVY